MSDVAKAAPMPFGFARRRAAHLRLGQRGERLAAALLRRLGLDVLTHNYRTTGGEIDLVAREQSTLCFIEVKTRHRQPHSRPADAVGLEKRRRVIRSAHRYLREIGRPRLVYRFDIIEVVLDGRRLSQVCYWRHAFSEAEASPRDVLPHLGLDPEDEE